MVGASGENSRDSVMQCGMAGLAGGLNFGGTAMVKFRRHRETQLDLLFAVQSTMVDLGEVVGIMHAAKDKGLRFIHLDDILAFQDPAPHQHVLGHLKLLHWKRVPVGKFEKEL
jgi:hypothetical protein